MSEPNDQFKSGDRVLWEEEYGVIECRVLENLSTFQEVIYRVQVDKVVRRPRRGIPSPVPGRVIRLSMMRNPPALGSAGWTLTAL